MNIPPRKEEGSYTYSSRMGGKLCLLTAVGSLPLLRSRCKNPPSPHNLCMFRFMIALPSALQWVKLMGVGHSCNAGLDSATALY